MARLQILELPEGAGGGRPPFVLVVDQADYDSLSSLSAALEGWQNAKDQIGARAVLVFEETIEIPANDLTTPVDEAFKSEVQDWAAGTNETLARIVGAISGQTKRTSATEGLRLAHERTDIARDMDRLAKWKQELTDALGIDRLRDWDDIRNAAAGLRRERDAQTEALERVRNLHRPVEHNGQTICWECSDYDFPGQTTDNSPVTHDQCGTLRALAHEAERSPEE